jgi:hypothetical protein
VLLYDDFFTLTHNQFFISDIKEKDDKMEGLDMHYIILVNQGNPASITYPYPVAGLNAIYYSHSRLFSLSC